MNSLTTILTATNSSTPNNTSKSTTATKTAPPTTVKFGEQLARQLQWLPQLQRSAQLDLPQPVAPPKAAAVAPPFTVGTPASSTAGSKASLAQASQPSQRPKSNSQTANASATKIAPNASPASGSSSAQTIGATINAAAGHVSRKETGTDTGTDGGTNPHDDNDGELADTKIHDDQSTLEQATTSGDQAPASTLPQDIQRPLSLAELLIKSAAGEQSATDLLAANVQAAGQRGMQLVAQETAAITDSVATVQSLSSANGVADKAGSTTEILAMSTLGVRDRHLDLASRTQINPDLADQNQSPSSIGLPETDGQRPAGDAVLASIQTTAPPLSAGLMAAHTSAGADLIQHSLSALTSGRGNSTVSASANSAGLAQVALSPLAPDFSERFAIKVGEFAAAGADRAEIRLSPAELGPIHLRISMVGSDASITLSAHHPDTLQAIERSVPMLRQMLAEQGVRIDSFDLNSGSSNGWSASANSWGGAGNTGSQARRSTASSSRGDDSDSTEIAAVSGSTRAAAGPGRRLIDVFV